MTLDFQELSYVGREVSCSSLNSKRKREKRWDVTHERKEARKVERRQKEEKRGEGVAW